MGIKRICICFTLAGVASSVFAQMTLVPRDGGGYDIQNSDGTRTVTRMAPRPGGGYEIELRDGATIGMLPRSGGGYEIRNRNGITTLCNPRPDGSLVCDSSKKTGEITGFPGNGAAPDFRGATMTPGSRGTYEVHDRDGTTTRVTPGPGNSYEIHSPDGTTTRMTARAGGSYKIQNRDGSSTICSPRAGGRLICY